jgi:hypothetical protein
MTLGIALVLIFVLYLIDKHNLWRKTFKGALWVVALAVLGVVGMYVRSEYQDWKLDRYTKAHVAMKERVIAKYATADKSALARICSDRDFKQLTTGEKDEVKDALSQRLTSGRDVFDIVEIDATCKVVTLGPPVSKDTPVSALQDGFVSLPKHRQATPKKLKQLRATLATELVTEAWGDLGCGQVEINEVVSLLAKQGGYVRVKTASGQSGWAYEGYFELLPETLDFSDLGATSVNNKFWDEVEQSRKDAVATGK